METVDISGPRQAGACVAGRLPLARAMWVAVSLLVAGCGTLPRPGGGLGPDTAVVGYVRAGDIVDFRRSGGLGSTNREWVWDSPVYEPGAGWDQLVASWNPDLARTSWLKVEVACDMGGRWTRYYDLGSWAATTNVFPRTSVQGPADADGRVATDTLVMSRGSRRFKARVTAFAADPNRKPRLRFLGFSLADTRVVRGAEPASLLGGRGVLIEVPERSQLAYPGGEVWCSPASVSMILAYWAKRLGRSEMDRPVPEVADRVHDPGWPGTGNWSFNAAYAGSFDRMRAVATRLENLGEVERWVAHGVPVALSVCYNRLRGREGPSSGHLVVCVGFTQGGDVIVNDPGTRTGVRKVFDRARVLHAWEHSSRTVYLIHPEGWNIPHGAGAPEQSVRRGNAEGRR
jgi:Peptidase_C39 like family